MCSKSEHTCTAVLCDSFVSIRRETVQLFKSLEKLGKALFTVKIQEEKIDNEVWEERGQPEKMRSVIENCYFKK